MKNKTGIISGFILGVSGFLLLFKIFVLSRISPEDEIAPGAVMMASLLNGLLFAFIGSRLQGYFLRKKNYKF